MSSATPPSNVKTNEDHAWEDFVEVLATGKLPVLATIEALAPRLFEAKDHEGFVTMTRAMHVLMEDKRIQERFVLETLAEMEKALGKKPDLDTVNRAIRSKDGQRRFAKLGRIQAEMFGDGPSLLSGATFEECLGQYSSLVGYVEHLWDLACQFYRAKDFPLCTFFSILSIEETGKLGRLWFDLLAWDRAATATKTGLGELGRSHRTKHFMAVVSGATINARLDRVLGAKNIRKLLEDAESGKLERLRQSCLYIDVVDGRVVKPADAISEDTARFFVVLAGELWAETLGHFPWEFQRMITRVAEFEVELGYPKAEVWRQ